MFPGSLATRTRACNNRSCVEMRSKQFSLSQARLASVHKQLCWLSKEIVSFEHSATQQRRAISLVCCAIAVVAGCTPAKLLTIRVTDFMVASIGTLLALLCKDERGTSGSGCVSKRSIWLWSLRRPCLSSSIDSTTLKMSSNPRPTRWNDNSTLSFEHR
jgi:hypothetical protein